MYYNSGFYTVRLATDPVVRKTESGIEVANFRVALNDRRKGSDGQFYDNVGFLGVTAWRSAAEKTKSLKKGDLINLGPSVKLLPDNYEKNGEKRSGFKFEAHQSSDIQIVAARKEPTAPEVVNPIGNLTTI